MSWIELGAENLEHGGKGWELGKRLWCPTVDRRGSKRYKSMTLVRRGDFVWHVAKVKKSSFAYLVGHSTVKRGAVEDLAGPPNPERWAGFSTYYRVELRDFVEFGTPFDLRSFATTYDRLIRQEIQTKPPYYPFAPHGRDPLRLTQGLYLGKVTSELHDLLLAFVDISASSQTAREKLDRNEEFVEAKRRSKEREFFARNPNLARAAKELYGYLCMGCGFDFRRAYGEEYIECHHMNPLAERASYKEIEELVTSVSDVCVLCANCHRMIHRKKKVLTIGELKEEVRVSYSYGAKRKL